MSEEAQAIEPANVDAAAPEPEAVAEPSVEELAREMGWKPRENFEGDAERYKGPADFIRAERDINRGQRQTLQSLKEQVSRMAQASELATKRALEAQRKELEQTFAQAVSNKDVDGAARAAAEIRTLDAQANAPAVDYEADFKSRNPWYGVDEVATNHAIVMSQKMAREGVAPADQLARIEQKMRKDMPHLFDDGASAKQATQVSRPTLSVPRKRNSYADLPKEAKEAADNLYRMTKERWPDKAESVRENYARDYFSNIGA